MSRLLALSLALLLVGCSAATKSGKKASSADSDNKEWKSDSSESSADPSDEPEPEFKDPKRDKLPEGPSCLDTKGDVQQCLHDSDCCKGFYCGIDPAGSARIKVCLFGG